MRRSFRLFATGLALLGSTAVSIPRVSAAPAPVVTDLLFAVVRDDCTIARSLPAGAASCLEHALGNYTIKFDRNVRGCAYFATIGLAGHEGTSPPGFISVVAAASDPRAVYVKVDDITANNADRGFHLMVDCKRR